MFEKVIVICRNTTKRNVVFLHIFLKELIEKIEENYNIKQGAVYKELYIKGLKDGINLIIECKD